MQPTPAEAGHNGKALVPCSAVYNHITTLQPGMSRKTGGIIGILTTPTHTQIELARDVPFCQQTLSYQHLSQAAALPRGESRDSRHESAYHYCFIPLTGQQRWRRNG